MNFADLNNRHAGLTGYILGTGPSLDDFDLTSVKGGFWIVLHRAMGVAPSHLPYPTYWQVLDDAWTMGVRGPWHKWLADVKQGNGVTGLFRDPLYLAQKPWSPGPAGEAGVHPNIVRFGSPAKGDLSILDADRREIASRGELFTYVGSGCTAVHAAWYMGASRVVLVGLDGEDGYAKCLSQWYDAPARGGYGYYMAREATLSTADGLGLEIA